MTHFVYMITQKWLVKAESDICSERKSWNDFYFSAESTFQESGVNKAFTHVRERERAMSPRHSARIQSGVGCVRGGAESWMLAWLENTPLLFEDYSNVFVKDFSLCGSWNLLNVITFFKVLHVLIIAIVNFLWLFRYIKHAEHLIISCGYD